MSKITEIKKGQRFTFNQNPFFGIIFDVENTVCTATSDSDEVGYFEFEYVGITDFGAHVPWIKEILPKTND